MSSFGHSHRQIVSDTNAGNVLPPPKTTGTSTASVSAKQTQRVGKEYQAAQALVDVASTGFDEVGREANRKKERDAYINAGTEEGRQVANSAAGAWHNKLFGADASLRGAQERIAEDNARNLYLKAADLLENGGADSWDDETWEQWRDDYISEEVNKYDDEEMRDFVNSSMSKDFQKLERDRGYLHQQYVQAEANNTVRGSLGTIAKTLNADLSSTNPNRQQVDSAERLQEIADLKESTGIADVPFANAVAQIAAEQLALGNEEFYQFAQENGLLEDTTYETQEQLEQAQRIHEIKNDEAFGDRSNEIFGPRGHIARGNVTAAMEAYDQLVADYPEAAPAGGRNQVRDQVRQQAWANQERARIQQERIHMGMDMAATGQWTAMPQYDGLGNLTGYSSHSPEEKMRFTQMHIAERMENQFHANQQAAAEGRGEAYERVPMTPEQRDIMYAENSAYIGEVMARNGIMVPEVSGMAGSVLSTINYGLEEMGKGSPQYDRFMQEINALESMYKGNPQVMAMMAQELGDDFGKYQYVKDELARGKTPQEVARNLAAGVGTAGNASSYNQQVPTASSAGTVEHQPSWNQLRQMRNQIRDDLGESTFFGFGGITNMQDVDDRIIESYSRHLSARGSTSKSAQDIAMKSAIAEVAGAGAIVRTNYGQEFVPGAGVASEILKERGYEDLNSFLDTIGSNEIIMNDIRRQSGEDLTSWRGNPLTSQGVGIEALDDGTLQLLIPREDGGIYRHPLQLPTEEHVPRHVIQDQERHQHAMSIVDSPEQWREQTGNKLTPREELDQSLNKQILAQKYPMGRMSQSMREEQLAAITQEERDVFMPAHLYNEALIQRQQQAAEKTVRQIRRRELMPGFRAAGKYKQDIGNMREAWRRRGTKPEEVEYPSIPYYREGMSLEDITQSLATSELEYARLREEAQMRYLEGP